MSEHPELREAIWRLLLTYQGDKFLWSDVADALLAGPVGKLQAELAEAKAMSDYQCSLSYGEGYRACRAQLADPERIRREAIGAAVLACRKHGVDVHRPGGIVTQYASRLLDDLLAAGESAVTGEAT